MRKGNYVSEGESARLSVKCHGETVFLVIDHRDRARQTLSVANSSPQFQPPISPSTNTLSKLAALRLELLDSLIEYYSKNVHTQSICAIVSFNTSFDCFLKITLYSS